MGKALSTQAQVRAAGGLYLVIILCGLSAELALRGPALAGSLVGHVAQLRLAALLDLTMLVADIALAVLFYVLLQQVSQGLALAAMMFRLGQAAMIGASLVAFAAVPDLAGQDETLARIFAGLHATGYDLGLVLFGVNSLLMAWLLRASGQVPLGILCGVALSGLVYITGGVLRLIAPEMVEVFAIAYIVPMLAESALCLWLLGVARL